MIKEPPLGVIREQGEWPLRPKGAGSKENVIWEQGAQKYGKGSREQQKIGKWSKEQKKSSGSKGKNSKGAVKIGKRERAP